LIDIEAGDENQRFSRILFEKRGSVAALRDFLARAEQNEAERFYAVRAADHFTRIRLIGSGHLPAGRDEIYQIGNPGKLESGEEIKEPLYLTGTAEPSLLAYYAGQILNEKELPIKMCGISQCYRSEAGSYGKDAKGLYRLHEFMKVEQVVICKND